MHDFLSDKRFDGIEEIAPKMALLAPATPHRKEKIRYIEECYDKGWITTSGDNINVMEADIAGYMSTDANKKYAVDLTNGTAAPHLTAELAAEKLYGSSTGISTPSGKGQDGSLYGKRVFVTDMTFDASVNPVLYEGGEPVFIDSEYETWNMDPQALEKAFEIYPDVKLVIFVHLYGVPGKIEEVKSICEKHGALLIEDTAESLGVDVTFSDGRVVPTGSIGDYAAISMNGNKIITGSLGSALICHQYPYDKAKKWSTQAREVAPWYEHEELGYSYRISNIIAGVIRGQWPHLEEHIAGKKRVFEKYKEGLKDLPVQIHGNGNYWLSGFLIDEDAMESFARSDKESVYESVEGKSCPSEILEALNTFGAEGRPIWKPMHLQPMYRGNEFITINGRTRGNSDAYIEHNNSKEVPTDIFVRGQCLPTDNKLTSDTQDVIIKIIKACFE